MLSQQFLKLEYVNKFLKLKSINHANYYRYTSQDYNNNNNNNDDDDDDKLFISDTKITILEIYLIFFFNFRDYYMFIIVLHKFKIKMRVYSIKSLY